MLSYLLHFISTQILNHKRNLTILKITMYGYTGNVGSSAAAAATPGNPAIANPLLHHHQLHQTIMIPVQPSLPPFGGSGDDGRWSSQETRDLIEIRAQLEWAFTEANMNINLWELVAERIREKGYWRTADQCKWKWESLVIGYEGQEASDADNARPFFNELHAVFTARANTMQQSQIETETGVVREGKRVKDVSEDQPYEDFIEQQEDEEEIEVDHRAGKGRVVPERKAGRDKRQKMKENEDCLLQPATNVNKNGSSLNGIQEIMRKFSQQQQMIDVEWRAAMEKRAEERERFEQEWRQKMENLEREALMMEQAWREREEERKVREERRAEQRDALITELLNRLLHEESP